MSNKMALEALTACPFCGGKADYDNSDTSAHEWIYCTNCGAIAAVDKWNERAAIAALQAEPQPAIPEGWAFSTADFSLQACGVSEFGGVMLIRTGADRAAWHALTVEPREVIPLYVSGTGRTVAEAIASAAKNCTPLPATPPKD